MKNAHSGFAAGGVQNHSAGEDFPVTHYCVGGYPREGSHAYWMVQHPCGVQRRAWTVEARDAVIAEFKKADKIVGEIIRECSRRNITRLLSERDLFERVLERTEGLFTGWTA